MRAHGLAVGTSEITDAARVCRTLGFDDRRRLRAGVAAAVLRRADDRVIFDQLFDIYFPAAVGARADTATTIDELRERLTEALATADQRAADDIAAATVELLGRVTDGDGWSAAQALDALAPQLLIAAAQQQARMTGAAGSDSGSGGSGSGSSGAGGQSQGDGSGIPNKRPAAPAADDTAWAMNPWDVPDPRSEQFTDRIDRDEIRDRVAAFRRSVESETRRRNAEVRDRDRLARLAIAPSLQRRDFLTAGAGQLALMQRELDPLARKLAARLTSRERAGRSAIDVRRTLRASMSTGGVPIEPVYQRRAPHRPDLVLLADLSGSVGGFSSFTMLLMQALHQHFRRVRIFGFVSTTAEITDVVRELPPGASLTSWALSTPALIGRGTSSSYDWGLGTFARGHLAALGQRSTVLILGDARNNFGDPNTEALQQISRRARHTVWLNPEPATMWDRGDSLARVYGRIIDMHECRNLEQLRDFVAQLLPVG